MLYVYSRIFCVLTSRQSRISKTEVTFFCQQLQQQPYTKLVNNFDNLQACERAMDIDNEFITSEIDSSYPQCSKDSVLNHTVSEVHQTTLYELLEYAKTRSMLKGGDQATPMNSHHGSFLVRPNNSVQFNNCIPENTYLKTTKKVPIRISSLKRESKTAQTLR
jgi:hypothetical protein